MKVKFHRHFFLCLAYVLVNEYVHQATLNSLLIFFINATPELKKEKNLVLNHLTNS